MLNNFKRRLIGIVSAEGVPRPSIIEGLILRHMQIIHLIEKHVSMDLKQGLREILVKEAFSGPMRDLQDFEVKEISGGKAVTIMSNCFMDNVVKDVNGSGVVFDPADKSFRTCKAVNTAPEILVDIRELKAFVRIFGPYGVDKLESLLQEYLGILMGSIDIALRANKDALETLALNMHHHYERDEALKQVQDIESLMAFSIQIGHAINFRLLLSEATAAVLESNIPSLFSLLSDFARYAPSSIPENEDVLRLKVLTGRLSNIIGQDAAILHSVLRKLSGAGDTMWIFLPYLYVCCMISNVWNTSAYSVHAGAFNNNVHCLARYMDSLCIMSMSLKTP
jgi:NCK-associated protein 1